MYNLRSVFEFGFDFAIGKPGGFDGFMLAGFIECLNIQNSRCLRVWTYLRISVFFGSGARWIGLVYGGI